MDGAGDAHKQAQRVASAAAAGGDEIVSQLHRRELHNKGASPAGRVSVTETEGPFFVSNRLRPVNTRLTPSRSFLDPG